MPRTLIKRVSKGGSNHRRSAKVAPITMPLQPIKCCQRIAPKERLFLDAAERGDRHTMFRCLQPPDPVNVNCTNMIGRSAIQIAVDNENVEICELLLRQEGVKIGDALLYAIREGVFRIVEMLIDHPSITPEMLGTEWSKSKYVGEESNDYSPDVSPVILAAHCNQFEILQLLLMRGAVIDRPHQLSCSCRRCQEKVNEDSLRHSVRRINAYRALASPAWISLTSSDPILTAFNLSWELHKLALRENEFKDTYMELSNQCKKCACDMLDQCRTTEEVIAVLNQSHDSDCEEEDYEDCSKGKLTLARLKLAIKFEQKEFVAHPNCQQLLTSIWYEGLPGWRKRNAPSKVFICLGLILIMPFMALYYWIFPQSRIGQILRSPFMKFLYHSASFGAFLILLICTSMEVSSLKGREKIRGPPPTEFEWLICLWVTGFIWSECKQLWEEGLKAYIRQWWNWLDFIMLSLYLTTITLRFLAYFQMESGKYGPRELERKYWPLYDPTMVSEGLFAIANVLSFARIIFLCQADQYLGPLQISLGCMLIDIAKFLFIFFLVITSFACGLNQLYWYYTPDSDVRITSFHSLENSYRTLYWSLFSMTQVKDIKIEGGQLFTEIVGELLFMAYQTMAVIVLINMLIAMMSSSFQEIENHADMEWKFTRSKLWMGYFDEGSTLPPPFNIIVSPKAVYYVIKATKDFVTSMCKCCPTRTRKNNLDKNKLNSVDENFKKEGFQHSERSVFSTTSSSSLTINGGNSAFHRPTANGDVTTSPAVHNRHITVDVTYEDIMRRLVTRYIHQSKKQKRQNGVNEDDLLEIKQDISSLRYEIREDRSRENSKSEMYFDHLRCDILNILRGSSFDVEMERLKSKLSSDNSTHQQLSSGQNAGSFGNMHHSRVADSNLARFRVPDSDNNRRHFKFADDVTTEHSVTDADSRHHEPGINIQCHAPVPECATKYGTPEFNNGNLQVSPRQPSKELLRKSPVASILNSPKKPLNYTSAKINCYLSHLGDDCSTSTSTSYPLPYMTSDPFQSHNGVINTPKATSYGYRLYADDDVIDTDNVDEVFQQETAFNHRSNTSSRMMSANDLDAIKLDILTSLRLELRDSARTSHNRLQPSASINNLPELESDLYQTHLYTQL